LVGTAGVNECPLPATRTGRPAVAPRVTAAATAVAEAGRSTTAGSHASSPAQFRHTRRRLA
jgi:hypothetical protein